mmetsp:Transcript_14284/g.38754  ORF Transcript_14284/g.38754 Transcript_14284/m.38754 type:complete len:85 (-) Transcript_14284:2788-3042(-)
MGPPTIQVMMEGEVVGQGYSCFVLVLSTVSFRSYWAPSLCLAPQLITELQPGGGTACVDVCKREKPCCGQLRGGCMFAKKKSTE